MDRFGNDNKELEASILRENSKMMYEKDQNYKTTNTRFHEGNFGQTDRSTNSTFGLTF